MKIHFLREDALGTLKTNIAGNIKKYELATNDWVYELCDSPFVEFKLPIGEFKFVTASEAGSIAKADAENAIRLYTAMMDISDAQATDERLWAGLTHGDFYSYMHERWQVEAAKRAVKPKNIAQRYFLCNNDGVRRALFLNTLARLWWLGRLTYDKTRKDPFELTRYWETDFGKILPIFSNNFTSNREITKGLIEALLELKNSELAATLPEREICIQAASYLNIYGGIHILDYYKAAEIKEKVLDYMYPWLEENAERLLQTK